MLTIKVLIIGVLLSLFVTGCSDVSVVKDGTLNFDNSITVGEAFDKYSYFSSTNWKDFETSNGRKIVEVTGEVNLGQGMSNRQLNNMLKELYNNKPLS